MHISLEACLYNLVWEWLLHYIGKLILNNSFLHSLLFKIIAVQQHSLGNLSCCSDNQGRPTEAGHLCVIRKKKQQNLFRREERGILTSTDRVITSASDYKLYWMLS